ncbi:hypothetical protein B0H66DRAFT_541342 [Apodospora peruviana]|uniref:Secreted protein n=1 Tax=Apodospora peruviana TaxID=516989 RepID=A0AAE0IR97_9PEZI|nr:hypothetical protein B0H66DRAFT_541342 [Apodospora peruviana]
MVWFFTCRLTKLFSLFCSACLTTVVQRSRQGADSIIRGREGVYTTELGHVCSKSKNYAVPIQSLLGWMNVYRTQGKPSARNSIYRTNSIQIAVHTGN